jgi:hypothetical protein
MIKDLNEPIPELHKRDPNAIQDLDLRLGGDAPAGSAPPESAHTTVGNNPEAAPEGAKNPSAADIIGTGAPQSSSDSGSSPDNGFAGGTNFLPDDDNK